MFINVNDRIGTGSGMGAFSEILMGMATREGMRLPRRSLFRTALFDESGYCIDAPMEIPAGGCRPFEPFMSVEDRELGLGELDGAAEQITTWRE